jgi:ABC-type arginine transport system permease subunit
MDKSAVSTIVKLAIISLPVGVALAFFDISPRSLVENLGGTVVEIYEVILRFLRWAVQYILLGAVVVLPIWLVFFLIRLAKKK